MANPLSKIIPALKKLPTPGLWRGRKPKVAVVRLYGAIGQMGPLRSGLSLEGLAPVLQRAFGMRGLTAVALAINSPGGSPVQSSLIAGRIRQLAEEKEVPVFAFIEDVGASGGYWLATAADEIYADPASIVGSIGVVSAGFGFQDAIGKLGIERRVHTAGDNKAILDPFQAEKPKDVKRLKEIQGELHDIFKDEVRSRRGGKLTGDEKEMFSGAFWTGQKALDRGLIDGLGDLRAVLRGRYGEKVKLPVATAKKGFLQRRLGMSLGQNMPGLEAAVAALPEAALSTAETRALWARYGL